MGGEQQVELSALTRPASGLIGRERLSGLYRGDFRLYFVCPLSVLGLLPSPSPPRSVVRRPHAASGLTEQAAPQRRCDLCHSRIGGPPRPDRPAQSVEIGFKDYAWTRLDSSSPRYHHDQRRWLTVKRTPESRVPAGTSVFPHRHGPSSNLSRSLRGSMAEVLHTCPHCGHGVGG